MSIAEQGGSEVGDRQRLAQHQGAELLLELLGKEFHVRCAGGGRRHVRSLAGGSWAGGRVSQGTTVGFGCDRVPGPDLLKIVVTELF